LEDVSVSPIRGKAFITATKPLITQSRDIPAPKPGIKVKR